MVFAALIAYGSLYPFQWLATPRPWQTLLAVPHDIDRGDVLGNVMLFVPLGLSGAMALRRWPLGGTLLLLVCGVALAVALQVAQLWTGGRTAALYDAAWNSAGLVVGIVLATLYLQVLAKRASANFATPRLAALLIVAAWFASHLLPWVPSFDWQHIKDNLKPLRAGLDGISPLLTMEIAIRALPAGEALAVAFGAVGALLFVPAAALLLLGKAVVVGQSVNVSVVCGLGGGAALTLAGQLLGDGQRRRLIALVLFVGIAALALLPFDPYAPLLAADWVPFAGLLRNNMLLNARSLIGRLFLYAGLLWLLRVEGARPLPASLGLALWLAMLELLQVVMPGQRADLTEPLWALLCGWAVWLLPMEVQPANTYRRGASPAPATPAALQRAMGDGERALKPAPGSGAAHCPPPTPTTGSWPRRR